MSGKIVAEYTYVGRWDPVSQRIVLVKVEDSRER